MASQNKKISRSELIKSIKKLATVNIKSSAKHIGRARSGSVVMDNALGGGYPRGNITQFWGETNTGKTTTALLGMAEALKRGERCFYIAGERRIDPAYWKVLGLPMELNSSTGEWECILEDDDGPMIDIITSETAEESIEAWRLMAESNLYGYGVFDGITAIPTKAEAETDMTKETRVGGTSKLLTRAMRIIPQIIDGLDLALVVINQARDNIGGSTYSPLKTTGGHGLQHSLGMNLQFISPNMIWQSKEKREVLLGMILRFYVRKTSVSNFIGGMREVTCVRDVEKNTIRIDTVRELFEIAKNSGLFTSSDCSTWSGRGNCHIPVPNQGLQMSLESEFGANDEGHILLGNGQSNIIKTIRNNDAIYKAMYAAVEGIYEEEQEEVEDDE